MEYDCCVIGIGRLGLCFAVTLENTGLKILNLSNCSLDINCMNLLFKLIKEQDYIESLIL